MATTWDKLDKTTTPDLKTIREWVDYPLWDEMLTYMEETYQAEPLIEYSGCGMKPGWNVKFNKSGRGLCTLYPEAGGFIALVVIGQREKPESELLLPTLSAYTQQLYENTREGMGQRWLMFEAGDAAILNDIKQCISLRLGTRKI